MFTGEVATNTSTPQRSIYAIARVLLKSIILLRSDLEFLSCGRSTIAPRCSYSRDYLIIAPIFQWTMERHLIVNPLEFGAIVLTLPRWDNASNFRDVEELKGGRDIKEHEQSKGRKEIGELVIIAGGGVVRVKWMNASCCQAQGPAVPK